MLCAVLAPETIRVGTREMEPTHNTRFTRDMVAPRREEAGRAGTLLVLSGTDNRGWEDERAVLAQMASMDRLSGCPVSALRGDDRHPRRRHRILRRRGSDSRGHTRFGEFYETELVRAELDGFRTPRAGGGRDSCGR